VICKCYLVLQLFGTLELTPKRLSNVLKLFMIKECLFCRYKPPHLSSGAVECFIGVDLLRSLHRPKASSASNLDRILELLLIIEFRRNLERRDDRGFLHPARSSPCCKDFPRLAIRSETSRTFPTHYEKYVSLINSSFIIPRPLAMPPEPPFKHYHRCLLTTHAATQNLSTSFPYLIFISETPNRT
jgi:hypothetical protein